MMIMIIRQFARFGALFLCLFAGLALAAGPVVFYTDLDSGPNTGGENGLGAYVTIYGNNFGALRSTSAVKIGAGFVSGYTSWSNTRIVVQLGPAVSTGSVVVTAHRASSNTNVTFTVRTGNIYFIAPRGSDSNDGSFAHPWATLKKCSNSVATGDTCYAEDGVVESTQGQYNCYVCLNHGGTSGRNNAIVAYPGATVIVGSLTSPTGWYGFQSVSSYWTIAGLHIYTPYAVLMGGLGFRLVGNEMQCPTGDGAAACVESSQLINGKALGNEIHTAGCGENGTPCAWNSAMPNTISTVGTALTMSASASGASAPARFYNARDGNSVIRYLTSCSDSTHCTINAPFTPDLPSGTTWYIRDYAPNKQYHSLYFSSDSSVIEAGWNNIHDSQSCRGIQFHSSPINHPSVAGASNATPIQITVSSNVTFTAGQRVVVAAVGGNTAANGTWFVDGVTNGTTFHLFSDPALTLGVAGNGAYTSGGTVNDGVNQYDLSVHDNVIHGQTCDGINLLTIDPSIDTGVSVYNNLVYHAGAGWTDPATSVIYPPYSGESDYACLYSPGGTNNGPIGTGTVQVYNNTFYDCGSRGVESDAGMLAGDYNANGLTNMLKNNLIIPVGTEPYLTPSTVNYGTGSFVGTHNVWFGAGGAPAGFSSDLNVNPLLTLPGSDFTLAVGSLAGQAGTVTLYPVTDLAGTVRPSPPSIGAYEVSAGNTFRASISGAATVSGKVVH